MSKRVFIGVGHGGKDPGAVKYVKESEANLQIALGLKEELERYGFIVGISRTKEEDDPLTEEIKEANAFKPDIAVEVHNNAGGGDGFEVYRQTNRFASQSLKLAQSIEKRVKESGQQSRGVKIKLNSSGFDYFGWCRQVEAPAVLCEGFFVDSQDSNDYNTKEKQRAYGRVYAKGVLDYFGIKADENNTNVPENKPEENKGFYTVQVGMFLSEKNAENLIDKYDKIGYNAFKVKEDGTYLACVGRFKSEADAEITRKDMQKKGYSGFVKYIN